MRIKHVYILFLFMILISSFFISCKSNKNELQQLITSWHKKEVIIPALEVKIVERDTVYPELFDFKYKILAYLDSTNCLGCDAHLYEWKLFIKEIQAVSTDISFIFIVNTRNYNKFITLQKENRFNYPVFYDPEGKFSKQNRLPENKDLHTFLLNRNNQTLAIGNPLYNTALKKLYKKIISQ